MWLLGFSGRSVSSIVRRCALFVLPSVGRLTFAQTVLPAPDPNEPVGERPYEMLWANRTESSPPTVRFDHLTGWKIQVEGGAEASLQPGGAQNLWGRLVAKLRYRGAGKEETKPRVLLLPAEPIRLPDDADSVDALIAAADGGLYRAKQAGRNRVVRAGKRVAA